MASKHILEGLIKWSTRDRWADRFERILEDHEKERCAIIDDQMDRHYHRVLDEPVPALGGETPPRSQNGEWTGQGSDWLKMENRTAKSVFTTAQWQVTTSVGYGQNWASAN